MLVVLAQLLHDQAQVVARSQLLELGLNDSDVARMVRRRELVRLRRGIFVAHTGVPTWEQRAWAAVLSLAPAALSGVAAMYVAEGMPRQRRPPAISVVIAWERRVARPAGVALSRSRSFSADLSPGSGIPRVRYERAVWDVARALPFGRDLVAHLADTLQRRRTNVARLRVSLAALPGFPQRPRVEALLRDLEAGTSSVLEHGYLVGVERAHGLPRARRQVREVIDGVIAYRDVLYAELGVAVELDGRAFHDTAAQRDSDMDRDLTAAVHETRTLRLSYGQALDRPCWTAGHVARVLRAHGWTGLPRRCGPTCTLPASWGVRHAPGA